MSFPLHFTQIPGSYSNETNITVIGIDFGTSCTKVIIQNNSAGKAYAIPFQENGHPSNSFLLPTRPYFNKNGELCLSNIGDEIPLRELKSALVRNSADMFQFMHDIELEVKPEILAVAYLAQVIKLARSWFLFNLKDTYKHVKFDWQLNLGIPSTGKEYDEKKNFFKKLAMQAWWISTQETIINKEICMKSFELFQNKKFYLTGIHEDNINVIPEVVAEVIGYVRSDSRKNGLHLLVDIGAGTMDVSSFNLYEKDGENHYAILTGEVQWLGGFELQKHRIELMKNRISEWLKNLGKNEDPIAPIPSKPEEYLPSLYQLEIKESNFDKDFFIKCRLALQSTLVHIRSKRYPNAKEWKTGIPVFLCGGGKDIEFYQNVLKEVDDYWRNNITKGINLLDLSRPQNLVAENLENGKYHRLAVAYGLSFPEYEIGSIKPPNEIDDVQTLEKSEDFQDNFISKDQV